MQVFHKSDALQGLTRLCLPRKRNTCRRLRLLAPASQPASQPTNQPASHLHHPVTQPASQLGFGRLAWGGLDWLDWAGLPICAKPRKPK